MERDFNQEQLDLLARQHDSFFSSDTYFIGTSGEITPIIIDASAVMRGPHSYLATEAMKRLFLKHRPYSGSIDVIAGGQSRDLAFSKPLAIKLNHAEGNGEIYAVTHVSIFNNGDIDPSGALQEKNVVLVSDLNHKGYSASRKWIPIINNHGGEVDYAFFYVDRLESDPLPVRHSDAVIKMTDSAWDHLHANKKISPEAYRAIMEKRRNPKDWEERMLRSDQGIQRLKFYLENPNNRERGVALVERGYPHMRNEILERLPSFLKEECFPADQNPPSVA